jgi:uncharacterized protein (TIGR02646 family)
MIHIDPIEPDDNRWKEWRTAAKQATEELIAAAESGVKIDEKMYKRCHDLILERFHGKCAYCESDLGVDQHRGDVEHFRPKKRVRDENNEVVYVGEKEHPGYYWLAYEWTNLFPACRGCNQSGGTYGKSDRFPIKGRRATTYKDKLEDEDPLLLNPYDDKPEEHLIFDPDTGFIAGLTEKGRMTIKILGLDREELSGMRKRIAEHAGDNYTKFLDAVRTAHEAERVKRKEVVEKYKRGEEPYSAFARAAIARDKAIMEKALAEL